jgi:hypothetical protein
VSRNEIEEYLKEKTDKSSSEMTMRMLEVLHKQVLQISLLLTHKLQLGLEKVNESANSKTIQKVNLFNSALMVSNWI